MHYLHFFCLLLFFNGPCCLFGQSTYFRELIFQSLTVNDGLAHRTVHSITQDQQGFIWIGTNNGLNRYDGDKITTYRWNIDDSTSLPGNIIEKLYPGKNGRLWVITSRGQLSWYNHATDQFNLIKTPPGEHFIRDIAEDKAGNIWVICNENELFKLDLNGNSLGESMYLLTIPLVKNPRLLQINFDQKNGLWAEINNHGIHLFSISADNIQHIKPLFEPYSNMVLFGQSGNDVQWMADGTRIFKTGIKKGQIYFQEVFDIQDSFPKIRGSISDISEDRKGQIWISVFGAGLIQLRKKNKQLIARHFPGETRKEKGLSNPHIGDLFLDRYNVLWIGTQAGIFRTHVNQKPFNQISKIPGEQESLIHNIVHAIYRDKFLWIGTIKGLTLIDIKSGKFYNYSGLFGSPDNEKSSIISSIFKDSKGTVWVGTDNQGLFKAINPEEPEKLSFERIKTANRTEIELTRTDIRTITEDENGNIWIATGSQGIYILSRAQKGKSNFYQLNPLRSLKAKRMTNLYKDPHENTIWAGSWENGLIKIRIEARGNYELSYFKHESGNANSISVNHVNPIQKTDKHTLWVGTIGGGLNKISFRTDKTPEFQHFGTDEGLPDNTIHSILKDHNGGLWLGGNGLTFFDPESESTTHYDAHDGLQSNLFIVNAAFQDREGLLYFGGPYGLNFFDPALIQKEKSTPDLLFKGLSIMNHQVKVGENIDGRILLPEPLNQLEKLTIQEKENDLTFSFLAMHTASPARNRLRYRLLGYQDVWRNVSETQASVTYSNLKPGNYQFQISGCNGDGVWTPETKQLNITILPYWYKSKPAFLAYAILFIVLLLLFRRAILIQSNLKNNLKIAEIELQKDHEIAEMKTRFFNNITHELRSPLTLIQGPVEELLNRESLPEELRKNYYYLIRQNTQRLLNLVNRLLDFRKAETNHFSLKISSGNFISFAKEIFLSFQFLAYQKDIQYSFQAEAEELSLFFDFEKMEIVLCNLLSNAFKYSKPKDRISLHIRQDRTHCVIRVSDSGEGIPSDEVENIFNRFYQIVRAESSQIMGTGIGLSMVKEIVHLHQGSIQVNTAPSKGSEFIVRLPLGSSHFRDAHIVPSTDMAEHISHYRPGFSPILAANPSVMSGAGRVGKMLIVEDNPEIRAFIRGIFQEEFSIYEADNGASGLQALEKQVPDIIISDIMMDPMDGITFCQKLREHPGYLHIPIILLTARTSQVYKIEGLDSGADAYLTKPFNAKVLQAQVHSLLKSRSALKSYYRNQITLQPQTPIPASKEVVFMEKLIRLIEDRIEKEELTAESLAEAMAMSHSTLYRKIKTCTGESINSLIRSVRLKQAAELLTSSPLNISEVAWKVGFSDVNYFGKCFRKQFQMNPSEYIKSHAGTLSEK